MKKIDSHIIQLLENIIKYYKKKMEAIHNQQYEVAADSRDKKKPFY